MGNILYTIAIILIIFWAIGFFAYSAGTIIHLLLVLALLSVLVTVFSGRRNVN
ncbi:MAG: lmo0937 family membrane protein [Saprospirales bacterium]|nr:MAG: lmo0937 family membrane protein [Saprospirales bacterium]